MTPQEAGDLVEELARQVRDEDRTWDEARAAIHQVRFTWDREAFANALEAVTIRDALLADWRNVFTYADVPLGVDAVAYKDQLVDDMDSQLIHALRLLTYPAGAVSA